jgi:hypothetical protein
MKTCSLCKIEKEDSEFYKDSSKPDKLMCYCKKCSNNKTIKWSKNHKDLINIRQKEYRINNPERYKQYNIKHKDYLKEYYKKKQEEARPLREQKKQERFKLKEQQYIKKQEEKTIKNQELSLIEAKLKENIILKCKYCKTEDQSLFTNSKKNKTKQNARLHKKDIKLGKIVRSNWCINCQKIKDAEKRQKKNDTFDKTRIIECPICHDKGDYLSNKFRPNKYKQAKEFSICKKCHRNDIKRRLLRRVRRRIKDCLHIILGKESLIQIRIGIKTEDIIGCSSEEFKTHIEKQFTEGMSWNNYNEWHLDHIKPISMFNLIVDDKLDETEVKKANHYTNLRPLWAKDNLSKSNNY